MAEAVLELTNLRKQFGGLVVTDDVTMSVGAAELHAVIGPNGAGKTTLINQIAGLLAPDDGQIMFAAGLLRARERRPRSAGALRVEPAPVRSRRSRDRAQ
jgi:ABC-type branched-subunit amino acid transport system ATPase component